MPGDPPEADGLVERVELVTAGSFDAWSRTPESPAVGADAEATSGVGRVSGGSTAVGVT
ncbi:hypothetical protein GCM10028814_34680 [Angustibacter aerolatus]